MFEVLLSLSNKKQAIEYPDSGPGTKFLTKGTEDFGFFGYVDPNEFFSLPEFTEAMSLNTAPIITVQNTALTSPWIKYFWRGKVCYMPLIPFSTNTPWVSVYAKGAVYGKDANGIPGNGVTPVNQNAKVFMKEVGERTWQMRVRVGQFSTKEPASTADGDINEYGKVFEAVTLGQWDRRPASDLSLHVASGRASYAMNQSTFDQGYRLCVGANPGISIGIPNAVLATDGAQWRPVFELIPPDEQELAPLTNIVGKGADVGGMAYISPSTDYSTTDAVLPINSATVNTLQPYTELTCSVKQDESLVDFDTLYYTASKYEGPLVTRFEIPEVV